MQILTKAEAEEFWHKKMLKKGHCLGKAHCIYSDNTVYYTVYIYTLQHYLTRDYYDGFINDRVKYGSGKIWRIRSKPTTFSRSLFYRCPTFQLQNSKILFRMEIFQFETSKFGNFCVT